MPPTGPNWRQVAAALALLSVRRDVVDRTLVDDAETAARTAGLSGADELARAATLALSGTHRATHVVAREDRHRIRLCAQVVRPEPRGPLVEVVHTVGSEG